jgi:hypothetical protein
MHLDTPCEGRVKEDSPKKYQADVWQAYNILYN